MKLSSQGLLIVAVPLVFELVFVAVLVVLLVQAEKGREKEFHAKMINVETSAIAALFYHAGQVMISQATSTETDFSKLLPIKARMKAEFETLESLGKTPQEQEMIKRILKAGDEELRFLDDVQRQLEGGTTPVLVLTRRETYRRGQALMNQLVAELSKLGAQAKLVEQQSPETVAKLTLNIERWLVVGVVLNILIAIVIAFVFSRQIVRRIGIIGDNSLKLACSQQLNPPLEPFDEISDLDRLFHNMAQAVSSANEKERAILENTADVICSLSLRGKFLKVNRACHQFVDYSSDDLVGRNIAEIVHPEDLSNVKQSLHGIETTKKASTFECRLVAKDGRSVETLWTVNWSDLEGEFFCVVHDETKRKEMEALKQEFIEMVSHDLRTPLNSTRGILELMLRGAFGELPQTAVDKVHVAVANTDLLVTLVNELLDLDRLESGRMPMHFKNVALSLIIERAIDAVANVAETLTIQIEAHASDLVVLGDEHRLVQVLINLLSNALKYAPSGSIVNISVAEIDKMAEIRVSDKGKGIPARFHKSIFERFRQVEIADANQRGGTGLGLSIAKAIVELHGGEIGVDSQEGAGSTFWFRIQCAAVESTLDNKAKKSLAS